MNKNTRRYDAVPKNTLIWAKFQGLEPMFFFELPLRGHGYYEAMSNVQIQELRNKLKMEVYVDYFTVAKTYFYIENKGYEICRGMIRSHKFYLSLMKNNSVSKFVFMDKYQVFSLPLNLQSPLRQFAIRKENLPLVKRHLFPGTNVYNTQSLIDDIDLKTIQIKELASDIRSIVYVDEEKDRRIKDKYKYRVYEFVNSNSLQIMEMLIGKRMHWVDVSIIKDYHLKFLRKHSNDVIFLYSSKINPTLITQDELMVQFTRCVGYDLPKLKTVISTINKKIKEIRGSDIFWKNALEDYSRAINHMPFIRPSEFDFVKESIKYKKELNAGYFDYQELR